MSQITQVQLKLHYQDLVRRGARDLPSFADVEFHAYSQSGEDGILLYIFSLIGTTNRRVVEICAGAGIECNAANLIVNHGWRGLLFDGSEEQLAIGRKFYAECKTTQITPPALVPAWITTDNVNDLVKEFAGPIDLLSIDLDGNDYWIWKALDAVEPRVVVAEINATWGPEMSVAMSYNPDYRLDYSKQPFRCGASLPAFIKLARQKGLRFVGTHSLGFNAFFVRDGIGEEWLPERNPADCLPFWSPTALEAVRDGVEQWEEV